MDNNEIRSEILRLVEKLTEKEHGRFALKDFEDDSNFKEGLTSVPYAGRVFDSKEVISSVDCLLDFWLTLGKNGKSFEKKISEFLDIKSSVLTNSGSSANLLALSALTSHKLGDRRLKPGDEVITVAAGFPTTVAPILQNNLVPVFVDNNPVTLNIKIDDIVENINKKTKCIMIAHTLGNPFDLSYVRNVCNEYDLWLIEDNCDAFGCTYNGQKTGSFGDLSTQSFYPPHHLTMGEGGSINIIKEPLLKKIVESFRDWGRDCWCPSGVDNTCGKRYSFDLGNLPSGYDHKFTYSHWGYNLKPLDLQAAIGLEQLDKVSNFIERRKINWTYLRDGLEKFSKYLYFTLPTHAEEYLGNGKFKWDKSGNKTDCSWFGFMIGVKDSSPFTKIELAKYLEEKSIGNRMLFGGNLLRQPVVIEQLKQNPNSLRLKKNNDYSGADQIMRDTLFIGTYPGLRKVELDYIIKSIEEFISKKGKQ